MPEINFNIQWPDGTKETCYSPSLVIKKYFIPGEEYDLTEFVERSRTALNLASDRVKAAYGYPCNLAIGQLNKIETKASQYQDSDAPTVKFIEFVE